MSFKPRYIKAQEAEERIVALWRKEKGAYADTFNTAIDACQTIILDMYDNSSQDVVRAVRCKECKFASLTDDGECKYCQKWKEKHDGESVSLYLDGDFYCAWGERREDD